jgi:hypothetical protein
MKKRSEFLTPLRPTYSAICPLAMAPTMAPTLDSEPNTENCGARLIISDEKNLKARRGNKTEANVEVTARVRTRLGDGEVEVPDDAVLRRGRVATGEAELDGAERDDERAEQGGDVGLAQDGHGGGAGVEAGLARPHPHPVPAPAVGQQRLLQRAVVVAAALVAAAAAACPVARHGAALAGFTITGPARLEIGFVSSPAGMRLAGRTKGRGRRECQETPLVPLNGGVE